MKGYGQFCPIAKASEVFCGRWTSLILRDLAGGATRFSELKRGVPLASPTLLTARLRELEAEGIVERRKAPNGRSWTYHLTQAGKEFIPVVMALGTWGQRWSRRELADDEMDLDLLLWAMETHVHPEAFPSPRTLIEIIFRDQPAHKRRWWFLNESGKSEMCVKAPGFDVDLYVSTDLATMIHVWRGDVTLQHAMDDGRIEPHGTRSACRAFPQWIGVSSLAHVQPVRRTVTGTVGT